MDTFRNWKSSARQLCGVLTISAALAVAIPGAAKAEDEHSGSSAPIEGTWIVKVDRIGQGITFTALQSFTAGV